MVVSITVLLEWSFLYIYQKLFSIPDFTITSDAAGSNVFRIVYGSSWVVERWPPLPTSAHISVLELIPLLFRLPLGVTARLANQSYSAVTILEW